MSALETSPQTIEEMVSELRLDTVVFYHVSSSLNEKLEDADELSSAAENATESAAQDGVKTQWGVRIRQEGNEFGVRIRLDLVTSSGDITVDVAAEYRSDSPLTATKEVVYEYVNNVSLMQLFPYIREAVMTLSARVFGSPLLLPVFERGQIAFDSK